MDSRWSEREAEGAVDRYAAAGVNRDVALRVYTTRLLGGEPRLVLHGGGNTSVKTLLRDALGAEIEVICVKGSGWDMASIEPPGLPAVRLAALRKLIELDALSDEEMVNAQRVNLLNAAAPTPSVETLLHAFLPHKFVDHTHANAILALTDQADGQAICEDVFGDRVAIVPYVMPGFALSKAAFAAQQARPSCEGMILIKHGIFTFGEDAREAYERMIDLVSRAEGRLREGHRPIAAAPNLPADVASAAEIAPILRGRAALAAGGDRDRAPRFVVDFRSDERILGYVNGVDLERYGRAGIVTPDHAIRIKPWPLVLPAPPPRADPRAGPRAGPRTTGAFGRTVAVAIAEYVDEYRSYFIRNNARHGGEKIPLDPAPRVMLVRGLGLFALGRSAKDARIAADLAVANIEVITDAESIGRFESITESETFDIEYWSLEQAKLARTVERPLAGRVAVITGGAGTIGYATAERLAAEGAEIALLDRDGDLVRARANDLGGLGLACDVTRPEEVRRVFDEVCETLGGVDVLVSNAGAAWQGRIGEVADDDLRASFELNFFAQQSVASNAVRVMLEQGTGGTLLFNVSKQSVNPGPGFGPYGLPKAATLALLRQYAVDYGADGIRANGVNADRIRSGLVNDEMIAARSKARGVSESEYMSGNLLQREVTADDVAQAFVDLALAPSTTGAVLTVDGGNIAAAMR